MPLEASTVQDAVHPEHLVRFGTFEVDLEAGELRRIGLKLKLTGQPFQVLTILLEHPGRVVTREDLQKRLWPDTFVDVDHNLNTAINKIREVLGDLAESPRFVETLPRRGYRFIAPVTTASKERNGLMDSRGDGAPLLMIGPGDAPQVSSAPSGSRVHHHRLKNALVVVGLIFLTTVGSVVVLRTNHTRAPAQDENQASSTMQIVPVTTASGSARSPAFSPNGAWLAYIWDGPERKRDEVYVQLFGSDAPLRLTYSKKGRLGSPAWSPDGREIAFVRCDGEEDGVFVVPALGGAERRLTNGGCLAFPGPLAYLSDGKGLLMMDRCPAAEQSGLVLFSLMTGEKQCLAHPGPPNGFSQLWWFSLSPDGRTIAFTASESRATGTYNDIYVIPLSGGVPHRLTTDSHCFDEPLMWTPGGKSIVFFSERSTLRSLWRVPATGGEVQREVAYPAIGSFSADGHRLLYSEQADEEDPSIWRGDLARPAGPVLKNAESIRTQYPEMDAQPYADGMRIVWVSRRTGF
jgi:DNA-binding winged helix-turn-helix (wHTH) protein